MSDLFETRSYLCEQEDESFVRIKLTHQETMKSKVLSLKQDLKYWPTWELVLDPATSTWARRDISTAAADVIHAPTRPLAKF